MGLTPDQQPQWKTLTALASRSIQAPLLALVNQDGRFAEFSFEAAGLLLDLSRQRLDRNVLDALLDLARAQGFRERREALLTGQPINETEGRAVLHTALRAPAERRPGPARAVEPVMKRLAETTAAIREGRWRGATGKPITDVVHIGIGGSHLGPELVVQALLPRGPSTPRIHFVANLDANALVSVLDRVSPEQTLFVVVSKSFSTLETRVNAASARSWFLERMTDTEAIAQHFLAVSSNPEAAAAFGIPEQNRFELWDWVGGRFSVWSAVGAPILLGLGEETFDELLAGAHAMDEHFANAPDEENLPLLLALTGIWNYNFLGVTNHAILPYSERLTLLPAYLQQLMMESNGKRVHLDGSRASHHTMPIVWGGVGTNGQHAFHQLLHQGTRSFTADFILCGRDDCDLPEHHRWLLANALAQAQAMLRGDDNPDPHREVPGNHATTTIVLPALTPATLGALLALYEHAVFCQGVAWQINSFDQWGVELGKRLALPIREQLDGSPTLTQDAPTSGLISYLRGVCQTTVERGKS